MNRNRFDDILSNFRVNDNTAIPKNNKDKLYKLRPMVDSLVKHIMVPVNLVWMSQ